MSAGAADFAECALFWLARVNRREWILANQIASPQAKIFQQQEQSSRNRKFFLKSQDKL